MAERLMTNPFTWLSPANWRQARIQKAMAREAERRLLRVLSAYKDLVGSQKYQEVRQETETVLGEQLNKLLERAGQCPNCSPIAARITVLKDVVLRPVQMVWYEAQQERLVPDDEIPDELHGRAES